MYKKEFTSILSVFCVLFGLFISCQSPSDSNSSDEIIVPRDFSSFNNHLMTEAQYNSFCDVSLQCINQLYDKISDVWSTADKENFNLILSNGTGKTYLITNSGKQPISESGLDEGIKGLITNNVPGSYNFTEYEGKKCCVVIPNYCDAFDESENFAANIETFYHESFHRYVQSVNGWSRDENSGTRFEEYPINRTARTMKLNLFYYLRKASETDDLSQRNECLSKAKYFWNKYKSQYSQECMKIKENDIFEGTAQFFGRYCVHLFYPSRSVNNSLNDGLTSADSESYALGPAALLCLKKQGVLASKEQLMTSAEKTPVEVILEDVVAAQNVSDYAPLNVMVNYVDNQLRSLVEPEMHYVREYKAGGQKYLVYQDSIQSCGGPFNLNDPDMGDLLLGLMYEDGNDYLMIHEVTGFWDKTNYQYYLFPLKADEFTYTESETGIVINSISKTGLELRKDIPCAVTTDSKNNTLYLMPASSQE